MEFVEIIEKSMNKEARKVFLPMQSSDVLKIFADVSEIENDMGYQTSTELKKGIRKFVL